MTPEQRKELTKSLRRAPMALLKAKFDEFASAKNVVACNIVMMKILQLGSRETRKQRAQPTTK